MLSAPVPFISYNLLQCITNYVLLFANNETYPFVLVKGPYKFDLPTLRLTKSGYNTEQLWKYKYNPNIFVIDLDDGDIALNAYLWKLFYSRFNYNPKGKYIVKGRNIKPELAEKIQESYINDVIFISSSTGKIYTYDPHRWKDVRAINTRLRMIGTCQKMSSKDSVKKPDFSKTQPDGWTVNIWHCTDNTKTDLLDIMFSYLRINTIKSCINYPFSHAVYIGSHMFDVAFGPIGAIDNMRYSSTNPFYYDAVHFFIPRPIPTAAPFDTLNVFSWQIWLIFFISVTSSSFIYFILTAVRFNQMQAMFFVETTIRIISTFLHQSRKFERSSPSKFILLYVTIFMTFTVNLIYIGKYSYTLTTMSKGYKIMKINSYEEIIEKETKIGFPKDLPVDVRQDFWHQEIDCGDTFECLNRTITEKEIIVVAYAKLANVYHRRFIATTGEIPFVRSDPPLSVAPTWVLIPKGHPLSDIFNKYLCYLLEHGFADYNNRKYEIHYRVKFDFFNIKINLEHIRLLIIIWCGGILLSLLIFISEMQVCINAE
ncbi:hypothetical protein HHI36_010867 [Cryptolaemus montrouzieri]|uniref:Ionotropic receptor n=1 Tax=Cryptolaemus montrouzieri TaxID=559131 RepID=A0ABD2MK52_9CUCU